ncbi:all-trans-retinol 13,14-reductase [Pseudomonas cuatrocienegasensis]|uniref:All-trans-retinol 13,14-reductase n=1 Tax=Pseudomonas cuatrocienegasensis TaxID=543360 RepID=A0ABY1B8M7_9PSED|nr:MULTISPECIES: NAD(P)/FAD-dependent oxidoreductase [Pseudomonas]OEC35747.1 FAD-dependent oxidoreductase [Pseudomonas sp. 21C1]SEQ22638.1 all-trans-retinol 13,14-reductase [Pseudomonas cuatrocienegasensis]
MKNAADSSYKRARARGDLEATFDAIVIGSGAGGLTAAALLALDGKKVLVLERHAVIGGCLQVFKRPGFEWDVGLHYVGEVHRSGTLLSLFNKVTRGELKWQKMPDIYNKIAIGNDVFEYHAGSVAFKQRMKEYFPEEADAIDFYIELVNEASRPAGEFLAARAMSGAMFDRAFDHVAPRFMPLAEKTTLEVLRSITRNETLIAVLCGHFGDYASLPSVASFAAHAAVIRHYLDGASYPIGGAQVIAERIADTIRSAGGMVLAGADVVAVVEHSGAVVGVRMAGGEVLEAPQVISAIGIRQTLNMLDSADPEVAAINAKIQSMPSTLPAVVLNLGLDACNADMEVGPANIWIHKSARQTEDWQYYTADAANRPMPLHFISQPSAKDPTWLERYPGHSTMDICSFTDWNLWKPFTDTHWKRRGDEYETLKAKLTEEMLAQVYRFYPKARGRVVHAELATPVSFNDFLGRTRGDFMSFAPTPERYQQRWTRAFSPVKGLFFSGQDVAMGGVSGAMVGGLLAASAALGRDMFRELKALA